MNVFDEANFTKYVLKGCSLKTPTGCEKLDVLLQHFISKKVPVLTIIDSFESVNGNKIFLVKTHKAFLCVKVFGKDIMILARDFNFNSSVLMFKERKTIEALEMTKQPKTIFEPSQELWDLQPENLKWCIVETNLLKTGINSIKFTNDRPFFQGSDYVVNGIKLKLYERPVKLVNGVWYAFISDSGVPLIGRYSEHSKALICGSDNHWPNSVKITRPIDFDVWEDE